MSKPHSIRVLSKSIVSYPNPQGNHNRLESDIDNKKIVSYPNPQGNHNKKGPFNHEGFIVSYPNPQGNHNDKTIVIPSPKLFLILIHKGITTKFPHKYTLEQLFLILIHKGITTEKRW